MRLVINLNTITLNELPEEQREIAECIGIENYRNLVQHFGGCQIYIQKADTLLKNARDKEIHKCFNGGNYRTLSILFNLSESRVRYILRH